MSERVFNFSAGPATLPLPVLQKAQNELLSYNGIGMSIMEISHRSAQFEEVLDRARRGIAKLMNVPENYEVLFLHGGASMQFSAVPMNLLPNGRFANYITTGHWGMLAERAAQRFGNVKNIYDGKAAGYVKYPKQNEIEIDSDAAYVYYTSNETIEGVEFDYDLDGDGVPVICDMSSNILSKPIDVTKYNYIYAGAQKNIAPSGITVGIIKSDLLERINPGLPPLIDYKNVKENGSMPNTPNTFGIYMIMLVTEWLDSIGGVAAIEKKNIEKSARLYQAIDDSNGYYIGHADVNSRSRMNVSFKLRSEELDKKFCNEAEANSLNGLAGHRSLGGVRASIYNAFPSEGVDRLIDFMQHFAERNP